MTKQKILKIKVGEVYIEGKLYPVFQTAFRRESKKGNIYYQSTSQVFVQEIETKAEVKEEKVEA